MVFRWQRTAPRRKQPRELARLLVAARPLERLARSCQFGLIVIVGAAYSARQQGLKRALHPLAAVGARRPKNTTASWIFSSLKRLSGSRYSERRRMGRASALSRNSRKKLAVGCWGIACHFIRCYDRDSSETSRPNDPPPLARIGTRPFAPGGVHAHARSHGRTEAPSTPLLHARAQKRLLIHNAMVIYGSARPPFGPVDILIENALIPSSGSNDGRLPEASMRSPTRPTSTSYPGS